MSSMRSSQSRYMAGGNFAPGRFERCAHPGIKPPRSPVHRPLTRFMTVAGPGPCHVHALVRHDRLVGAVVLGNRCGRLRPRESALHACRETTIVPENFHVSLRRIGGSGRLVVTDSLKVIDMKPTRRWMMPLCGVLAVAPGSMHIVLAQDAQAQEIEEVVVTGTRLPEQARGIERHHRGRRYSAKVRTNGQRRSANRLMGRRTVRAASLPASWLRYRSSSVACMTAATLPSRAVPQT